MRKGQPCNHTFDCPANEMGGGFANCSCSWNTDKQTYCDLLPGDSEWQDVRSAVKQLNIVKSYYSSQHTLQQQLITAVQLPDGNLVELLNFTMPGSVHLLKPLTM